MVPVRGVLMHAENKNENKTGTVGIVWHVLNGGLSIKMSWRSVGVLTRGYVLQTDQGGTSVLCRGFCNVCETWFLLAGASAASVKRGSC